MWTPKRIILLCGSFVLFFLAFVGYAFTSIGRIDGLPPLPEAYWPVVGGGPTIDTGAKPPPPIEKRLEMAFGKKCEEIHRAIRLDIRSRGMLLSAENFTVMPDGRVSLTPISVAMFSKDRPGTPVPEISTIRGNVALIKFDRPVSNFSEIGSRKIEEAELSGNIEISSNRRRLERDQDLKISLGTGPLYYNEKTHRIWTYDWVRLEDHRSKPEPHLVKGRGMQMELTVEPQPGATRGQGRDTISGVKWVTLESAVDMTLHADGKQGFFDTSAAGAAVKPTEAKATPGPTQRSVLYVTTPGRFRYDLNKDHDLATFEAPPASATPAKIPPQVQVRRQNFNPPSNDHLVCTKLVMRVKRRDNKNAPARDRAQETTRVETLHATGPDGEVVLTSDVERLQARGADFFHQAEEGLTVLKGPSGIHVKKDDSEIYARDLHLKKRPVPSRKPGEPAAKDSYDVTAQGPGRIHFHDPKEKRTQHAFWANQLTSARDGAEDLLTLVGDARFIDEVGDQTLSADILKVWLDPEEKRPAAADVKPTSGRRPRHLEATGNVKAKSRDMNITENSRLVVWFRDEAPAKLPTAPPAAPGKAVPAASVSKAAPPIVGAPIMAPPGGKPGQPVRPYDLKARTIQAKVVRGGQKNAIDELWCEGAVHVTQAAAKAGEKGTEVKGETLKMTAAPEQCYVLDVTGDVAELHAEKMQIFGPQVIINQHTNMAWVVGDGAMRMDSATTFQGDALKQPVPLTVHWVERMVFNGSSAEFHGNIQAVQDKARLACQWLQVTFDRTVSLRHGRKDDGPPARVRYMVCNKDVRVEESQFKGKELVKYQRLAGTAMTMEAIEPDEGVKLPSGKTSAGNRIKTTGPGTFRVVDAGGADLLAAPAAPAAGGKPAPKPAGKKEEGKKLTYVAFEKIMDANSKTGIATFWEKVRVLHLPVESHEKEIDLNAILATELPEGGMFMRCDRLKVLDRPTDGKPNKQMEAHGHVTVQGRDFDASSDAVYYNQAKDQIIFEGKDTSAVLKKYDERGRPQTVSGKRIIYNRGTKQIKVEQGDGLRGGSSP